MNLPNKLTVARIIATPIFMATLVFDFPFHYLISMLLFIGASLTDMADGKIARSRGLVTNFGKFLDPLADKMLTTSAFLGFMLALDDTLRPQIVWITFIVLFREFAVSSVRLVLVSSSGKVVAANMWGKVKTVTQMAGIILALACYSLMHDFGVALPIVHTVSNVAISVVLWISAALCVVSGGIYLWDARDAINPSK